MVKCGRCGAGDHYGKECDPKDVIRVLERANEFLCSVIHEQDMKLTDIDNGEDIQRGDGRFRQVRVVAPGKTQDQQDKDILRKALRRLIGGFRATVKDRSSVVNTMIEQAEAALNETKR